MPRTAGSSSKCGDVRAVLVLCLLGLLAAPLPLGAQWGIGVEVGTAGFGGGASDTSSAGRGALRPYGPTILGLDLDRRFGRIAVVIGVRRAVAGLAEESADVL